MPTPCLRRTPKSACCRFRGAFEYNSSTCTLTFTLKKYCGDIIDGELTVEITGPDGIDLTEPVITGDTYTWKLYKPSLGNWTVDAELLCPIGVFSRSYSITLSEDQDCSCCAIKRPDFITVAAADCCAFGDGTYVFDVAPTSTCSWAKTVELFTFPNSPCPTSPCFTITEGTTTYYFHSTTINVTVNLDTAGGGYPYAEVSYQWKVYKSVSGGPCARAFVTAGVQWFFRINCESGEGTLTTIGGIVNGKLGGSIGLSGSYFPCGTVGPTVYVELV